MTCEDIIQRLLDERHISVKEAMIMIKELVKNLKDTNDIIKEKKDAQTKKIDNDDLQKLITDVPEKENPFWDRTTVCMYGVQIPGAWYSDTTIQSKLNDYQSKLLD